MSRSKIKSAEGEFRPAAAAAAGGAGGGDDGEGRGPKKPGYAGREPAANPRRFNRNLATLVRELVPPEMLIDYAVAIMEGDGNVKIKRGDPDLGEPAWVVARSPEERGRLESTAEQKQWAWTQLRQAGWGMPVQAIALEADIRTHHTSTVLPALSTLTPAQIFAVSRALGVGGVGGQPALAARASSSSPALDVESSESTDALEPASRDHPLGEGGLSASTDHDEGDLPASTDHAED